MSSIDFLPDRLNAEPIVFRGFTTPELLITAFFSVIGGLVVAIPFTFFMGWLAFPTISLLMPLFVIIFGGKLLARYKRGKPENFIYRRMQVFMTQFGFGDRSLILSSQKFALRRSKKIIHKKEVVDESI